MPCNIFKFITKNVNYLKKHALCDVFGFLMIYIFLIKFEKVNKRLTFPVFYFSESVLCHCEIFCWTTFGPDINVCIVHVLIFIKKYIVNLLSISFY